MRSGVSISRAYVAGDIRSQSSTCSHIGPPNWRSKIQKTSLEPKALTRWLTARSESPALKRFVWLTIHDVMKPPYEPPRTPSRSESRMGNRSSAVSTTAHQILVVDGPPTGAGIPAGAADRASHSSEWPEPPRGFANRTQ
jgi:hypothetical protein